MVTIKALTVLTVRAERVRGSWFLGYLNGFEYLQAVADASCKARGRFESKDQHAQISSFTLLRMTITQQRAS